MKELILIAATLAAATVVALVYWLVCQGDDEPPKMPPNGSQGWTEDETWDSEQIVR